MGLLIGLKNARGPKRPITPVIYARSCNSSVHELASLGMSWDPGQFCLWTDPLPDFVTRWTARDLAEPESVNTRP